MRYEWPPQLPFDQELLGTRLRRLRRRAGLSSSDLSEKAKVSKPYISLIESHKVPPPSDECLGRIGAVLGDAVLGRLARVYRTPPDLLALVPESSLRLYLSGCSTEQILDRSAKLASEAACPPATTNSPCASATA